MKFLTQNTNKSFDYEDVVDPAVTVNPPTIPVTWANTGSGELFICTDNTPDANVWVGQLGTTV